MTIQPMKMVDADPDEQYPYTVVSRNRDERGHPVNDRHMLWESCDSKDMADAYAKVRCESGYWVEVFQNIAYSVGA